MANSVSVVVFPSVAFKLPSDINRCFTSQTSHVSDPRKLLPYNEKSPP